MKASLIFALILLAGCGPARPCLEWRDEVTVMPMLVDSTVYMLPYVYRVCARRG